MARAGYEADKSRLFIQDRQPGQTRDLTRNFDRSVGSFTWSPDSRAIYFSAENHGESQWIGHARTTKRRLEEIGDFHGWHCCHSRHAAAGVVHLQGAENADVQGALDQAPRSIQRRNIR